ncbi:Negative regulator of sexual conjugation and meiosis [Hypsizygus marmoreus]|uniref:Negative regulator of sexual conjugation and meiosis n=1 Tax=Hypsizygus marmoreus TaxID=39966 RepID=A0A369JR09_HYPMA|nr:Negative regulator of sexual conjugation and meiosis [Hypsizygus marmoreus]
MVHVAVTDSMPDLSGQFIDDGRLKLLESLGSGAYGKVYRALDVTSPRSKQTFFAVKCLFRPERGSYQEDFQNREFTLHKLVCDHPNIVTLHRVIYDRKFVFVVLDLCTGGDLFAAITESQIFHNNVQLVKDAFVQLIDAVDYCHGKNVFHRDIKPENVLCSEGGTDVRLADFGLSIDSHVSKDFGCGSSYYMSPECIGKELTVGRYSTRHSDIWSLGVILTNMISGRNPWRYATTKDECFAAYLHDKDFLRQVLPISHDANTILKRIFNINPLCRITLAELRKEILDADTFFMTEDEISTAGSAVRKAVKSYSHAYRAAPAVLPDDTLFGDSSDESGSSLSSDEIYAFNSPADDHPPPSPSTNVPTVRVIDLNPAPSSSNSGALDSSSSASESDGPITPATHAIDPAIEVPDLPEGEHLDQPVISPASPRSKLQLSLKPKIKQSTTGRKKLIRMAFERIKALSAGSGSS